ncbi:MAG: hypothetical protein NVS9B12_12480 [Vulcanimicrobiaceae bacterium]
MLHSLSAALTLWGSKPALPGSVPYTRKYALSVSAPPGTTLALQAGALPANWVASFCTPHLCAPGHLVLTVPPAGRLRMEFTVVPDTGTRMKVVRIAVSLKAAGMAARLERVSLPSD